MRTSILMPPGTIVGSVTSIQPVQTFVDSITDLFISGTVTVNVIRASANILKYDALDVGSAKRIIQQINNVMNNIGGNGEIIDVYSPAIPTGFAGTADYFQAALSWNYVSPADSYNIYRSSVAGGPYTKAGISTTNFFNDTGLFAGVAYFYVITSTANGLESAYSSEVGVTPNSGALTPLIPTMTSNSTPSGVASASVESDGTFAWNALDGNDSTSWKASGDPNWIQYQFGSGTTAKNYSVTCAGVSTPGGIFEFDLMASNDGTNWTTIDSQTVPSNNPSNATIQSQISFPASYVYYRLQVTGSGTDEIVSSWQLYG